MLGLVFEKKKCDFVLNGLFCKLGSQERKMLRPRLFLVCVTVRKK